ncbi:HAD-IIIA family hydrolase [Paenibacillus guangzhouensis]|uniref:HAD-IIIA family hydrolase n=1 Tax=Paenibacillus guangzhouensis TaxID=1473112 RepID=UPI001266A3DC|nr:HAD-IIIA family hydrolase [Paenibacillus guangzhouensis]
MNDSKTIKDLRTKIEAVFIDRDGTIGGTGHFIHPKDFILYRNAQEAINLLKQAGIKVYALTNQHRISKGEAEIVDFVKQFEAFGFDQSYICPHSSTENCNCRKPNPGMLLEASAEHHLNLKNCVVIGDSGDTDMLAAHAVGALKVLVLTGWGRGSMTQYRNVWIDTEPDFVAEDILEAVKWIINEE